MKNSILVITAICISLVAGAQEKEWRIALHVDPNFSWMKPDNKNIESGETKINFGYGLMIDKMFTDNYAIGTGLNILSTGGQLTYFDRALKLDTRNSALKNVVREVSRTYNLKYLEIPLTLKLRTNEIGYITYWAQFGLGLGVNIRAKADNEIRYAKEERSDNLDTPENEHEWIDSTIPIETTEDDEIKDDINLFRASLIVAAGIEYSLTESASILAGVTFNNGFTNVVKNRGVQKDTTGNVQLDGNEKPMEYDLKAVGNLVSLNIGFLF